MPFEVLDYPKPKGERKPPLKGPYREDPNDDSFTKKAGSNYIVSHKTTVEKNNTIIKSYLKEAK